MFLYTILESDGMPECFKCGENRRRVKDYYGLPICNKCYSELELHKIVENEVGKDPFLERITQPDDHQYIKALNTFASSFPSTSSYDVLRMCVVNIESFDMSSITINSFIIGARSVLIFGKGGEEQKQEHEVDDNRLHFLLNLGNLIGIAIIGNIVKKYDQLGLNVDDDETEDDIEDEITMAMIDVLNDIRYNDINGELRETVIEFFLILTGR